VYRRRGTSYQTYSRGPDGDDDGGRNLGRAIKRGTDGDLVESAQL
jgi:hypothetical protein